MTVPLSAAVTMPDAVGINFSAFVQNLLLDRVRLARVGCACFSKCRRQKPKLKLTFCHKSNLLEEASSCLRTSVGSYKLSTSGYTCESLQYPFLFMNDAIPCPTCVAAVATAGTVANDDLSIASAAEQAIHFASAALYAAKDAMKVHEEKGSDQAPLDEDSLKLEKLKLTEFLTETSESSGQVSVLDNLDVSRIIKDMVPTSEDSEAASSCINSNTASNEMDRDVNDFREMLEQTFSSLAELKSVEWDKEVCSLSKNEVIEVRSGRLKERRYKRERIRKQLEQATEIPEALSGRACSTGKRRSSSSMDSCKRYRRTKKNRVLLTAAEEKHLAGKVQYLLQVEKLTATCKGLVGRDPTMQELASVAGMEANVFQRKLFVARKGQVRMILCNLGLVVSIAKRFQGQGISLQDLVQEGVLGLIRGIEKFKPALGFRLSTYVHWWIRDAVSRAAATKTKATIVPAYALETLSRVQKLRVTFCEEHGRRPTEDEVVKLAKLSPSRLRQIQYNTKTAKSADRPFGKDGFTTLGSHLTDESSESDQAVHNRQHVKKVVDAWLQSLSEREREVLKLRFPTDGRQAMTLEDIGILFNLTRERIRQIEYIAKQKLKCTENDHLKRYLEYA